MEGAVRSPSALMATAYGQHFRATGWDTEAHLMHAGWTSKLFCPQAHNTPALRKLACTTYVVLAIRLLAGHDGLVREVGLQVMLMHASSDPPTGHKDRL